MLALGFDFGRRRIGVAVGSDLPDKLLGVRDGFVRYFHHGLQRPVPVAVVPQPEVLMTTASSPPLFRTFIQARMLAAAEAWLSAVLPMWWVSAPQHPMPLAMTTSQP